MNALALRCVVGSAAVAALGAVAFSAAVPADPATIVAAAPARLTLSTTHGPGDGDQEIPTGPGVVIAKPNGGSTSNAAKKKAFCAQQLAVLNQDLQDVGAGKSGSDILAHDVYAVGQAHGCSWAKG